MSFEEIESYYGKGVEKKIEMHRNVPCVDGPYESDDGEFIAAVDIMPSEFDEDKCLSGCDLYEICAKLDKLHQILNDHSLGPVGKDN